MKVESKYKNPDKLIQQLRNKIKWEDNSVNYWKGETKKVRGELIISWNPVENTQSCDNSHELGILRPGDIVAIIGHVTEVSAKTDPSCKNESSEITYIRKETRRIGRWY